MKIIHRYRYILILLFILALGVIFYKYDPSASVIFPKCPVMSLTGFPCAGCGSQRAIHALLHLNIAEAARYNILVLLFFPVIGLMILSSVFRNRYPKIYIITHHPAVAYVFLAVILLWWVLRIVFGWYV